MKLILMPQLSVTWESRRLSAADVHAAPQIDISDDSEERLREAINRAINDHPETMEPDPTVDAPPFATDWWWLAWIEWQGDEAIVTSCKLGQFYGIELHGRVRFEAHLHAITVADFVRAQAEGHYPSQERSLVVTRTGEFGGNGAGVESIALWLLTFAPGVLVPLGIDVLRDRRKRKNQEKLEALAEDWATRNIQHPTYLREFVETKRRWHPPILGTRLAIPPEAARRLLESLGYEPGEDDYMELKISAEAMRARDIWINGESAQYYAETYEDIEEFLED